MTIEEDLEKIKIFESQLKSDKEKLEHLKYSLPLLRRIFKGPYSNDDRLCVVTKYDGYKISYDYYNTTKHEYGSDIIGLSESHYLTFVDENDLEHELSRVWKNIIGYEGTKFKKMFGIKNEITT